MITKLQERGLKIEWGDDLSTEGERLLTENAKKPIFVTHWPRKIKAFYMKVSEKDPEVVECADLQAPNGFGEIVGSSEREEDINIIIENLKRDGDDPKKYSWYQDQNHYVVQIHIFLGLSTNCIF